MLLGTGGDFCNFSVAVRFSETLEYSSTAQRRNPLEDQRSYFTDVWLRIANLHTILQAQLCRAVCRNVCRNDKCLERSSYKWKTDTSYFYILFS